MMKTVQGSAYRSCTENTFHFTCFNPDDPHDPSVGLINGQLSIPGNLLRREVFDPVVNQVGLLYLSLSGGLLNLGRRT